MEPILKVSSLCFCYPGQDMILNDVNIELQKGECLCMLGPNGCGKTTLFNCIIGNHRIMSGRVQVNGKNISEMTSVEIAKTMGIVFQEHSAPFPYTSIEVVRMGRTPHLKMFETPSKEDTELALSIMEELSIAHLAGKSYTQISGGERQLVLIARTLCQQPQMILFDEPTSHLDFKNQAMILETIKKLSQKGMTIVMTTHYPNHVFNIGTHVAMMRPGSMVAQGIVQDVMTEENLTKTYGINVKIFSAQSQHSDSIRFCEPIL